MEPSGGSIQQNAEINALNGKLQYDAAAQIQNQGLMDNQADARAWQELKLTQARDAHTVAHLAQLNCIVSAQVGDTSDQQTVDPVRTATGDAIAGTIGVSADAISASMGNLATSLVPVIASAVATATSQTLTAVLPVLIAAIGTAATSPAQTTTGTAK
jgi:hypothetical protein